jgi:autotransporter-associated beta strand protein
MQGTSYLAAISLPVGLMIFAGPSRARAATTVFNDNFNRANANDLGANWTAANTGQLGINGNQAAVTLAGSNTIYFLSGLTGAYTHTTLKVDVSNPGGVGGQSIALCIGQATLPSSEGLFLQLRTTDVTGQFNVIELDTGVNMSDSSKWTTPTNQFIPTPFASARITASALDVDTIRIGIDSNFDSIDDQAFTRDLNLGNMGFGNRMGLSIAGSTARADNFSASVIDPANVIWNVAGGGTWDSTSNNWTGGGPHPNKFFNTDHAIFNSTFGGTITLAGGANALGIAPSSTTVNAAAGTYTFAGSGITSGTLTKTGTGRLVLTNPNAFTGITTVSNAGGVVANGTGAHLTLNNPSGNALSGDLHIGVASAAGGSVAKVNLAQSNQIADNRVISFDSSAGNWAYLSLRGNSETVAGIVSTNTGGVIENGNFNGAINTNGTVTLAPPISTTHTFSGIIRDADSGGGTGRLNLAVNGAGTQVLTSPGTYTYTGTTNVSAGMLRLEKSLTTSSAVNVTGGTLELASDGSNSRVIKTPGLTISGAGKLDLKDNKLIIAGVGNVGTASGGVYTGMSGLIQSGRNGGAWNGGGIVTSMPAAASGLTSLAVATAQQTGYAGGTFGGVSVAAGEVVVMYTYAGDANLDGFISGDDYSAIDFNVAVPGASGWFNGDFNYDGVISGDDYSMIDFNIVAQGAPIPTAARTSQLDVTAVPEPLSVGWLLLAGGLAARRRKPRRTTAF